MRPARVAWLITGSVTVLAIAAGLLTLFLPSAPERRSPMGSALVLTVRGDGSETLYTTSPDWTDLDCTVTNRTGQQVRLRADMTAQGLLGPPAWYPRGGLIDPGLLIIHCDDPRGGEFGVGPTRSFGFVLLQFSLYALAALAAVPTLILMIIDLVARRRTRPKPTCRQ